MLITIPTIGKPQGSWSTPAHTKVRSSFWWPLRDQRKNPGNDAPAMKKHVSQIFAVRNLVGFVFLLRFTKLGIWMFGIVLCWQRFYCIFCFFCRGGGGWNKKTSMWIKSICWSTTGGSLLPMFHLGIQTSPPSFKSSTNEDLNVTQYGFLTPQIVAITTLSKIITLPETNKSHLEMDGWNTIVSFLGLEGLFSGANYC